MEQAKNGRRGPAVLLDKGNGVLLSTRRRVWLAALLPLSVCSFGASAEETPPAWQHTVLIYGMGAAIDGTATIGSVEVPVNASISSVFDALEFGAMAAYRAENGTWSFTGDATFMGLGGSQTTEGGRLRGELDVDQLTLMGTAGRRMSDHLEFLFGLAYVNLSTDLRIKSTSGEFVDVTASRDVEWIDPTIGLQYSRPISSSWRFNLRGDIGGFGVGSDFMYQFLANVRWQASERVGAVLGYRVISFDYKEGKGLSYQHYDLTEQGPMIGITVSF